MKLVIKGVWQFKPDGQEEKDQVFLYQKVAPVIDEELIVAYFMPQPSAQRIQQRIVSQS